MQLWTARGAYIALNGVKIRTLSLQPAVVEVRVKTTAPGTVRLMVDDLPAVQQESDGEAVFTLTLDNACLWTPETPNLYTCRVNFAYDVVTETFGVRKVEWGTDGFLLNGNGTSSRARASTTIMVCWAQFVTPTPWRARYAC